MADLTPRQHQILGLLLRHTRGLSIDAVAKICGLCRDWTKKVLGQLRKLGLAEPTSRGGWHVVWTTPDRQPALSKQIADRVKEKQRAAARRRWRQTASDRELRAWLKPVRRVVQAGRVPPPVSSAPISVFHLANNLINGRPQAR